MIDTRNVRTDSAADARLLRDVRFFFRAVARVLKPLLPRARGLRRRLAATASYKRADGRDDASRVATWDLAGTLDVLLVSDIERMLHYLDQGAQRADRAARQACRRGRHQRPRRSL